MSEVIQTAFREYIRSDKFQNSLWLRGPVTREVISPENLFYGVEFVESDPTGPQPEKEIYRKYFTTPDPEGRKFFQLANAHYIWIQGAYRLGFLDYGWDQIDESISVNLTPDLDTKEDRQQFQFLSDYSFDYRVGRKQLRLSYDNKEIISHIALYDGHEFDCTDAFELDKEELGNLSSLQEVQFQTADQSQIFLNKNPIEGTVHLKRDQGPKNLDRMVLPINMHKDLLLDRLGIQSDPIDPLLLPIGPSHDIWVHKNPLTIMGLSWVRNYLKSD